MRVLEQLQPQAVFHWFEEICAIPHGSGNTDAISAFLLDFAAQRGLSARRDDANNVVIHAPASAGYETHPAVILQGHIDMVTEKTDDCEIDFLRDGLRLRVDGDRIRAEGTTLGADDGIAVAMALAILDDPAIPHPPLEVVLTADEETGLCGAQALDCSDLRGRVMLNLDNEVEGAFLVGCAGGVMADVTLPVTHAPCEGSVVTLTLSGLRGGHSGAVIHRRVNAIKLLAEVMPMLPYSRLISVEGGTKHNAIPRSCRMTVAAEQPETFAAYVQRAESYLRGKYPEEKALALRAEIGGEAETAMSASATAAVVEFLATVPNGAESMHPQFPKVPLTSSNLAIVRTEAHAVTALVSIRSGITQGKKARLAAVAAAAKRLGGSVAASGDYAPWEYREGTPLQALMQQVYCELHGEMPQLCVAHGAVECGVFLEKMPGLDVVSYGPDIGHIHTPDESLSVSSVARVWADTLELLKRL